MLYIVEQTRDEKIAMYMKLRKREIAEMLVNANDALHHLTPIQWTSFPSADVRLKTINISPGPEGPMKV